VPSLVVCAFSWRVARSCCAFLSTFPKCHYFCRTSLLVTLCLYASVRGMHNCVQLCVRHRCGILSTAHILLRRCHIIQSKPIGEGLNGFRKTFILLCKDMGVTSSSQALAQMSDKAGSTDGIPYYAPLTRIQISRTY
jgi:hypothetical protein